MAIPPCEFVQRGEEQPITEEEIFEIFKSPNAVRRNLFGLLEAWETKARHVLSEYSIQQDMGFPDAWPANIKAAPPEVKDAWRVLIAIGNLHVQKGNLCQALNLHEPIPHQVFALADAGIALGLAILEAHTRPYTQPAAVGIAVKAGGDSGALGTHGARKNREANYAAMLQRYEELRNSGSLRGHYEITNVIGKEFGISGRRVRDHVPNTISPRKSRKKV